MSLNLFAYGDEEVESRPKEVNAAPSPAKEAKVESRQSFCVAIRRGGTEERAGKESEPYRENIGGEESGSQSTGNTTYITY